MKINWNIREAPDYRARWAPIFMEPIAGSGERITIGVVLDDRQGREVRRTIRADILKSMYGSKRDHLLQMIDAVLASVRDDQTLPVTGFTLGGWREAASHAERYGVFRQAVYRTCSLTTLGDLDESEDEEIPPQDGTARQWLKQIRDEVIQHRPQLSSAFNVDVALVSNGLPPKLGFFHARRAANFETLRPSQLAAAMRSARGRLYELTSVKKDGQVDLGALVIGVPHKDELTYPERLLEATSRALYELQHEASADGLSVLPAYNVHDAVGHVLQLVAA